MKRSILLLFFSVCFNLSFSQWNIVNIGTTQDLYSVDYYSPTDTWIGSYNQFVKTSNGGANWTVVNPIKDVSNATIQPANIYDMALTGTSTGIATGFLFMGNNECILTTANAGTNWTIATNNNTVGLPRYLNAIDINSTRVIAVGNNGRIARSINSGSSWTFVSSGTTALISDVKFVSFDTVIAVGTNISLKSVNGGLNWTSTTVSGGLTQVSCVHNVVYASAQYGSTLLKSTDYGASYSTVSLPFTFNQYAAIYALSKDTLLAAATNGVYISTNGGTYWEQYVLPNYQPVNMFDFLNPASAIGVGFGGYVIKTNNILNAPSLPISGFTIPGSSTHCLGDSITLTNTTAPLTGYTYQWRINGNIFSTGYTAGIHLNTEGSNTIQLIVNNNFGADTTTTILNVTGHTINPVVITASSDSVCTGNMVGFTIANSMNGVTYQLRKGYVNIGTPQTGNGGVLNFATTTAISATTQFNFKEVKTTTCFTDSLIEYKTVSIYSNPLSLIASCLPSNSYCASYGITNVTFNTINNTTSTLVNNYFNYSCCIQTDLIVGNTYPITVTVSNNAEQYVAVWIDYDNNGTLSPAEMVLNGLTSSHVLTGNITVPAGLQIFNQTIRMRLMSNTGSISSGNSCGISFPCGQIEDYALKIIPAPVPPTASFTATATVGCTTSVAFTNTTTNALSYSWDFGDGSAVSNLLVPSAHVYSIAGTYTITLTACNGYGCDSATQIKTITIPSVPIPATCNPVGSSGYAPSLGSINIDTTMYGLNGYYWKSYGPVGTNLTCTNQLTVHAGSTYYLNPQLSTSYSGPRRFSWFIDYNNDGVFSGTDYVNFFGSGYPVYSVNGSWQTIQWQIPENTVQNTPLRMRIMVYDDSYCGLITNGCGSCLPGYYHDFTIIITPGIHPTPNFTASQTAICSGNNITFTNTTQNATTYLWDFGDGTTSTAQSPAHNYVNAGTYSIKLIASNAAFTDSTIRTNYITITQGLPIPVITKSGNILSTNAVSQHYQWFVNNTLVAADTFSSVNAVLNNYYVVKITSPNGCITPSAIFFNYPLTVNFSCTPTTLCGSNSTTVLNNYSGNLVNNPGFTVYWGDGNQDTTDGSGTLAHTYSALGAYTVKMVGYNSVNYDSLTRSNYINVTASAIAPVITLTGNQLSTAVVATSYQWYKNNIAISGATASTYSITQEGMYKLKITDGGCSAFSADFGYYLPHISFASDTVSFCNTLATTTFNNTSSNTTSYFWDFGDGTTSTAANPSHTYNGYGTYTVKLRGCDSIGCDSLTKPNYITLNAVPYATTSIIPTGTINICNLDQVFLSGNSSAGNTYQWRRNDTTIAAATDTSYIATSTGVYNLITTNGVGCSTHSNSASIIVNTDCVWPGDADNNHTVDNTDLLPIGVYYSQTGTPRSVASNTWTSFPASDWGVTENPNGIDLKHADCNGDGVIDDNDTLAISQNFSSTHAIASNGNGFRTANPEIYFVTSATNYNAGDLIDVEIWVGNSSVPVSNFYGIAFSINFISSLVQPGTAEFVFAPGWMGTPGADVITFSKIDVPANTAYGAITRVDHTDVNGYGKIASFRFRASYSISSGSFLYLNFTKSVADDALGNNLGLNQINSFLYLSPFATGITHASDSSVPDISIFPNPYSGSTTLNYSLTKKSFVNIEVYNILGEKVETLVNTDQAEGKYNYSFSAKEKGYNTGVYFVKITMDGKSIMRKIVEMK